MSLTLPPINGSSSVERKMSRSYSGGSSIKLQTLSNHHVPQSMTTKERCGRMRNIQRDMTKSEVASHRQSYIHSLCVDMLREGHHYSYKELYSLIHMQLEERERRGPESAMWTQTMLRDEKEKLDILKHYLTSAENSYRKNDFKAVYMARADLAVYFQQTDKWLSDHFFKTCLETASLITDDEGQAMAEAHCKVGLALEESGEVDIAMKHFEEYYDLSQGKDSWTVDDLKRGSITFFLDACTHLCRIYTAVGNQYQHPAEVETMLEYLNKAYQMATSSEDAKLRGEAGYRLGMVYLKMDNLETALAHLSNYYSFCKEGEDIEGLGRACDGLAKAYSKMDNKEKSIEFLKEFVECAELCGMEKELGQACHNLGHIFNTMGNYSEAKEYFTRAYNISRAMPDNEAIQVNRVQCGIAQAHDMLKMYCQVVYNGAYSRDFLDRNLDWKSLRADIYASRDDRLKNTESQAMLEEQETDTTEQETEEGETSTAKEEGEQDGEEKKEAASSDNPEKSGERTMSMSDHKVQFADGK